MNRLLYSKILAVVCLVLVAPISHAGLFGKKKEKAPPQYIEESCNALIYNFGPVVDSTKLQKETAWKSYRGKAVIWEMTVSDVKPKMFRGYDVYAKCQNSNSISSDILVKYPEQAKEALGKLSPGSTIKVRFILEGYTKYFGIYGKAIFDPNDFGAVAHQESPPAKVDRNKASVPVFNLNDN